MQTILGFIILVLCMSTPARADIVHLFAAGSLKSALTDIANSFEAATGNRVEAKYGPSGLLKNEISHGGDADVFASANMEHPQALREEKKSGPVIRFARNKLCALVKPGLAVDTAGLLNHMIDPGVKLGTSTPNSDPSGDYAFEVFRKAELIKPGAQAVLEHKALKLTGAASSEKPPPDRMVYGWHIAEGRADIFLTYCSNALAAQKENAAQQIVQLPSNLAVAADYGLTVINGSLPAAQRLADFILSPEGQTILMKYGFTPGK